MTMGLGRAIGVVLALAALPAGAQERADRPARAGPEIALGVLAHGIRHPGRGPVPPGYAFRESEEERGTADIQAVYRSAPLTKALKPRLTARLQINTDGRTSFAAIGAEWRQHVLRGRVYGQIGIGLAIHDGRLHNPDPFEPGISLAEATRRYDIYSRHTAFGSRVLFNPNLSLGVRVGKRWAVELAYEHFSHKGVFGEQNPGIDMLGLRLVRAIGR